MSWGYRYVRPGISFRYQSMAHRFQENTASQWVKTFPRFEKKKYREPAKINRAEDGTASWRRPVNPDGISRWNALSTFSLPFIARKISKMSSDTRIIQAETGVYIPARTR